MFVASGLTADMSCLHLMHGDPCAETWTDVTSEVSLHLTHLYAVFYISHFSWYAPFHSLGTILELENIWCFKIEKIIGENLLKAQSAQLTDLLYENT